MFEGHRNPIMHQLNLQLASAIKGTILDRPCAKVIEPIISDFYGKLITTKISWCGSNEYYWNQILDLGEVAQRLSSNTSIYLVGESDVEPIRKIVEELELLHAEIMKEYYSQSPNEELDYKLETVKEIVTKNAVNANAKASNSYNGRAGMVFQSYEHLWKLIHRINIEWLELRERGFKKQVIYDFEMSMQHLRLAGKEWSEEEKWNAINGILDGGKKFIPLIQCQPICYKVVDCESTETYAVENWKNRYSESDHMQEKDGK